MSAREREAGPSPAGDAGVAVDLKNLFSGQQFSFLPQQDGESPVAENGEQCISTMREVNGCGEQEEVQGRFFFHWCTPELSNRHDHSFHSKKSREEMERGWPEQRAAVKSMLRKSHRHTTQLAKHKIRSQTAAKLMS